MDIYMKAEKCIRKVNSITEWIALRIMAFIFAFICVAIFMCVMQKQLGMAEAQEFIFGRELSKNPIVLPPFPVVIAPGEEQYKNDRLAYYQDVLKKRGITNMNDLRLLSAQLLAENGAMTEDRLGDSGCSFGLIQYNACAHHGVNARKFLADNKEWQSWEYQLQRMADMVAERYARYDGNMRRVIIHHNSPACASRGCSDTRAGYYSKIVRIASTLSQ